MKPASRERKACGIVLIYVVALVQKPWNYRFYSLCGSLWVTADCLLLNADCLLLTTYCLLLITPHLLLTTHYVLSITSWWLLAAFGPSLGGLWADQFSALGGTLGAFLTLGRS